MKIKYGFIKGDFLGVKFWNSQYYVRRNLPHYSFIVKVSEKMYLCNINVQSRRLKDPQLKIYYSTNPQQDLTNLSPFNAVADFPIGVYVNPDKIRCLDYLRGKYFDLNKMVCLDQRLKRRETPFFFQILDKQLRLAQENNYQICIWGKLSNHYVQNTKRAVTNIHMNQGNKFLKLENDVWQDGALAIFDGLKIKFVCFLAFNSQSFKTDENGHPLENNDKPNKNFNKQTNSNTPNKTNL